MTNGRKCKKCGKELIGKEKRYCKICWGKLTVGAKETAAAMGSLLMMIGSIVLTKGKFGGGKKL